MPEFPPLFSGLAVKPGIDPFDKSCSEAIRGCDSGLVVHSIQADRLRAAMVLVPEVPLRAAMAMLPVAGLGFQNALGALAPPEVAVHLTWWGDIQVNGARCGRFRIASDSSDPDKVPAWLVTGLDLPLLRLGSSPGEVPDETTLYDEGCSDVSAEQLLESWIRHTLVWINRWSDEGAAPVHREWLALVKDVGDPVENGGHSGVFLGVDEDFGMLIRDGETSRLVPMTTLLEGS